MSEQAQNQNNTNQASSGPPGQQNANAPLDDKLIKEIAEKVYRLFLLDLNIDQERCQRQMHRTMRHKGGV